jgi:sec-independent protein translocase protein TatB
MFGMAWSEILVILVIAVVVVGPKDIPKIMYTLGRLFRRMQYAKFAMTQQFDEILRAGDIEELRKGVNFEARHYDEAAADKDPVSVTHEPVPNDFAPPDTEIISEKGEKGP